MTHRDIKEQMINEQSIPIKHRSCLKKHQPKDKIQTGRGSTNGRVSFEHATLNDGKILVSSQSHIDSTEKKRRSATFAKKARELRLAELNYFKDHAQDKEPIDE